MKRVTKFGKEIYALETNAINHLGAYHLSKHLFNLSFLHDPNLRESKSHERGSIEVVYQLANFHRMDSRQAYDGLFLHPMTIACDSGTRSSHSWQTLQASIEPLIADVEISIPDTASNSPEAGWFYPLLPYPGHRQPFPDRSFLTSNYEQLDASAKLKKKRPSGWLQVPPCSRGTRGREYQHLRRRLAFSVRKKHTYQQS